jgi:hypothetical protein
MLAFTTLWSYRYIRVGSKKLIPGLETGPILIAPRSIEGVVDRDAG